MCLPVVSSLILASVRCSKNTKYIGLVWIKAVQECRLTSDNDLFICWPKMLHFFCRTGSNVDQLEQDSLLLKKPKLFCAWQKIFTVHEQRKGGPLGQTVGSLQLILTLSGTDLVCFPRSNIRAVPSSSIWKHGSNFSHFQVAPEWSSPSLQILLWLYFLNCPSPLYTWALTSEGISVLCLNLTLWH